MMQPRKPVRRFTGLVGLPPEPDAAKPAQAPPTVAVGETVPSPPQEKERMVAEIIETVKQRLSRRLKRFKNIDAAQKDAIESADQKYLQALRDKLLKLPVAKLADMPGTVKGAAISEDDLRQKFGLEKPESKPKLPESYRQLLNLDPQDIINFFDVKLGERTEFAQADFVVPPPMLEHRIRRLQNVIARSRQVREGMASRIIKIRRGKDDPLLTDKAARERYKRGENARIARSNAKLFLYRAALRSGKNCHKKIWRWVTKPVYFRDVVEDCMVFATVTDVRWEDVEQRFTGGLQTHTRVELLEFLRYGNHVNLEAYRAVMSLGEAALAELGETETEQKDAWQSITRWENAVIRAAVHHHIITPHRDLAELLGLGAVLDEDDEVDEADRTEDALAIKTGGACYGGRIKGEGFRYRDGKITPRSLSDFDKPLRSLSDGPAGYEDAGFGSLRHINDDVESYDPR